jgi:hypothetical protein
MKGSLMLCLPASRRIWSRATGADSRWIAPDTNLSWSAAVFFASILIIDS